MTRAVLYARVSTDAQAAEGVSLESQRDMAERYCRERGWELAGEYRDVMSGRNDKRPQLRALEADAKARRFEVVLVYRTDRLARSFTKSAAVMAHLAEAGVALVSMTEPLDLTSPMGKAIFGVLAGFAEQESENIGQRVRDAKRYGASRGVWQSNRVPYGYKFTGKETGGARLEVDEEWAPVVRQVFAWAAAGETFHAIAHRLNQGGQPTRGGAQWHPTTVRNMLMNPTYSGRVAYGRRRRVGKRWRTRPESEWTVSEAAFPALVDAETWAAVQARLAEVAATSPRARHARTKYPWSGLVCCGTCGYRMTLKPNRGHALYACRTADAKCAVRPTVPVRFLDEVVLPKLLARYRSAATKGSIKRERPGPDPTRRIKALEARIARAKRLALAGVLDEDEAAREVAAAREELAELQAAQVVVPMPVALPDNLLERWTRITPTDRGDILRLMLERVEIAWETATARTRDLHIPGWPRSVKVSIPRLNRPRRVGRRT
ncbi:MAG: recombinase family protein [Rhodospirillaceae bacterium]